jgi:hypothetical protein
VISIQIPFPTLSPFPGEKLNVIHDGKFHKPDDFIQDLILHKNAGLSLLGFQSLP